MFVIKNILALIWMIYINYYAHVCSQESDMANMCAGFFYYPLKYFNK